VLDRGSHLEAIERLFRSHDVVAILGPRQIGKTTLARLFAKATGGPVHHFDLEDADDLARLAEPSLALGKLAGLIVIDEIQRRPELFPALRVLVDRPETRCRFLVLGSASPDLLHQSSETLAGRIAYHELPGFSLAEVGVKAMDRLWERGGFPRSFLAQRRQDSLDWREQFVRTFLERDIPQLGLRLPAPMLRRFWSMVAHYHGQIWNAAEIAGSLGLSNPTVRGYRDTLVSTFMLRSLAPWVENMGKRQVKSPKIYLADSGLLHTLMGIEDLDDLAGHPKLGASWKGFVIGQIVERLGVTAEECFFWATHQGAELDLLVVRGGKRLGFEIKRTTAPAITKSMRVAVADLRLDELDVVHAGTNTFALSEGIRAVAAARLLDDIASLR
jgi:predicted AAA+ superfamily ATPase